MKKILLFFGAVLLVSMNVVAQQIQLLVNQVAYDMAAPKHAIIKSSNALPDSIAFELVDTLQFQPVYKGKTQAAEQVKEWSNNEWYSRISFTDCNQAGTFLVQLIYKGTTYRSHPFSIGYHSLGNVALPAIAGFFHHQRANSPEEMEADTAIQLYGSNKKVNLQGGWCDASGDVSKYFSHLAYTNFMSPQQIPLVVWSMVNTVETIPAALDAANASEAMRAEAVYGAAYLLRSLSDQDYFYMTVFSYFNKDPHARRVVGLLADSKTTADYQCAWREGGGMAIAGLARISQWKMIGDSLSKIYLQAAQRAFTHLQQFGSRYADDGKQNIIDDYCALMAATELWKATQQAVYKQEARRRAGNLRNRLTPAGYFISDDGNRPFWHASDAGLPIIALVRYLDMEKDNAYRQPALATIKKALDYNLAVTHKVENPFGYARQTFRYRQHIQDGFFIPHENESGWWWQGEDARLASLATAAIKGGRLVYPAKNSLGVSPQIAQYAFDQLSWILGVNPYDMCMMYGFGKNNVPYMKSMYGHGTGKGGISNGITGGNGDGSGIAFKVEDNGNEWRWSEQWIPHSAWFLQAVTAISQ